jgi:hypothetical protein
MLDQPVALYMSEVVVYQCFDAETELELAYLEAQESRYPGISVLHQPLVLLIEQQVLNLHRSHHLHNPHLSLWENPIAQMVTVL